MPFVIIRIQWLLLAVLPLLTKASENGLQRTPPMGWMSWAFTLSNINCDVAPNNCIREQLYMEMADKLVSDGFLDAGYRSIHVDDAWMEMQRDSNGRLVPDRTRFPHGIKNLAKYMHDRNLLFGLYTDIGTTTCMHYPGVEGYEQNDANSFAAWDVDYLKVDMCNTNRTEIDPEYIKFGGILAQQGSLTGRPIVYGCSWPFGNYLMHRPSNYTAIKQLCNTWRNFNDVNSWLDILSVINYYDDNQYELIAANGPGGWNDPDQLLIGHPALLQNHGHERVQMSIWSIWSAPLIMSNDLRTISNESKAILLNRKVIAIDQDPMGNMGRLVLKNSDVSIYLKNITPVAESTGQTSKAMVIFCRQDKNVTIRFALRQYGMDNPGGYLLEELWSGHSYGQVPNTYTYSTTCSAIDAKMLKATLPGL